MDNLYDYYDIPPFKNGQLNEKYNFSFPQNTAKKAENVWFNEGHLCSRPGFFSSGSSALEEAENFTLTDVCFSSENKTYHIGFSVVKNRKINVIFVNEDGECEKTLGIDFSRGADYENAFFMVATPTKAGGIYLFLTEKTQSDKQYILYEINDSLDAATALNESDIYAPTILINGRGQDYEEGESTDLFYDPPIMLERLNLLNPVFTAFFNTDSHSAQFIMPVRNLDNAPVNLHISMGFGKEVDFNFPPGVESATGVIGKSTVICNFDREAGFFNFEKDFYPFIPSRFLFAGNNPIKVTARKTVKGAKEAIFASKNTVRYSKGNYVYGSTLAKNAVFSSAITTPLYFPDGQEVFVGKSNEPITALKANGSKLLAFKKDAVYGLSVRHGSFYKKPIGEIGDKTRYVLSDTVFISGVLKDTGCESAQKTAETNGKIAFITGGGNIGIISRDMREGAPEIIENKFLPEKPLALLRFKERLLLCGKTQMALIDISNSKAGAFIWRLPENAEFCGGVSCENGPLFVNGYNDNKFLSVLKGNGDVVLQGDDNSPLLLPINCKIETPYYIPGSLDIKYFEDIMFSVADCDRLNIRVLTKAEETNRFFENVSGEKQIIIKAKMFKNDGVKFIITAQNNLHLFGTKIKYTGEE